MYSVKLLFVLAMLIGMGLMWPVLYVFALVDARREQRSIEKALDVFWLKYYVRDEKCFLCDNTGAIPVFSVDILGIPTYKGSEWCICPNGRARRGVERS